MRWYHWIVNLEMDKMAYVTDILWLKEKNKHKLLGTCQDGKIQVSSMTLELGKDKETKNKQYWKHQS